MHAADPDSEIDEQPEADVQSAHVTALVERFGVDAVIARLAPLVLGSRLDKLRSVTAARRKDLTLLLERFYDPHNYAAVLRSAEAFGLCAVHYIPGRQGGQFSTEVSRGAQKWIEFVRHEDFPSASLALQDHLLVGADPHGMPPEELPKGHRLCLVMGAEKPGLSQEVRSRCDALVSIEMVGFVESFNVSVAAALLLSRLSRAQPPEPLSENERRAMLARYLVVSVGRAEAVLSG